MKSEYSSVFSNLLPFIVKNHCTKSFFPPSKASKSPPVAGLTWEILTLGSNPKRRTGNHRARSLMKEHTCKRSHLNQQQLQYVNTNNAICHWKGHNILRTSSKASARKIPTRVIVSTCNFDNSFFCKRCYGFWSRLRLKYNFHRAIPSIVLARIFNIILKFRTKKFPIYVYK